MASTDQTASGNAGWSDDQQVATEFGYRMHDEPPAALWWHKPTNPQCTFTGCLARFSEELSQLPPDSGGSFTGWYWYPEGDGDEGDDVAPHDCQVIHDA